jgi:hypothetical protein
MSKIIKKLEVNDFWQDCLKEKNISTLHKNNNLQKLALKPLINYSNKLKRNKII